jgi:hypothetical protein
VDEAPFIAAAAGGAEEAPATEVVLTIAALDNVAEFTAAGEAATACEALVATEDEAPTAALAPAAEVF